MISRWVEGTALGAVVVSTVKATKEASSTALLRLREEFLLFLRGRGGGRVGTQEEKEESRVEEEVAIWQDARTSGKRGVARGFSTKRIVEDPANTF